MKQGELDGQVVLVTGGAGFLGAHLCRSLLDRGCRVVATSRRPQPEADPRIDWLSPDLESGDAVTALVRDVSPHSIFHLAGDVSASPDVDRVASSFGSLLASTVHVLTAALEYGGPRVLLAGSLTEPDAEGDRPVPSSPYAAAKWAASGYARMFHALYGLPIVILRPFMTYGPGQNPEKLVPYVIGSLLSGEPPMLSSGHQGADWIYVDDVVDGMVRAVHAPADGVCGETIDLGSGALATVRDVVARVHALVGGDVMPVFDPGRDRPLERPRVADLAHAAAKLDWRPSISLDEGLDRTIEWIRRSL